MLLCCGTAAFAQDNVEPIIETLQLRQKAEYQEAAPSGRDEPLAAPVVEVAIPRAQIRLDTESALEKQADVVTTAVTLDEQKQTQAIDADLQQFGYDMFSQVPTTFAPVENIPVPPDYLVGPGDNIVVQLYGKKNVEYKLVVTRENRLLIPEFGPLNVGGMTFDEMKDVIIEGFDKRVIGAKAVVTMGQLRTIQIRVAGDMVQPGVFTIGGLSTLVDALLATGGVTTSGSLRKIQVKRRGKTATEFDLYDLLLRGDAANDIQLQHNDVIFAPPIGDVIYIAGEVQRPAIYELRAEKDVRAAIKMAGGLLPGASLKDSHIERIVKGHHRTLIDIGSELEDSVGQSVKNGDVLRILPLDAKLDNIVLLSGNVLRPGGYPYDAGMRVSDLVVSVDRTLPNTDLDFALIQRESESRRTRVVYVDLAEALENPGGDRDPVLMPRDELRVFNLEQQRADVLSALIRELDIQATDSRPSTTFSINGYARYTGRFPIESGRRLLSSLQIAGGLKPGVDVNYGVLARTLHPADKVVMRSFSIERALASAAKEDNPVIMPGDRIYLFDKNMNRNAIMAADFDRVRSQQTYSDQAPLVQINGRVAHPGTYPLDPLMRASDLICAAGGLTREAYGLNAELSRHSVGGDTPSELTHTVLNTEGLLALCSMNPLLVSDDSSQPARELAALYYNDERNPLLSALDQLTFVDRPEFVTNASVTLAGEVARPGVYVIDRGETLCSVLSRAGGLTTDAYLFGAEFTRVSVRELQQQTLDAIQDQLDDLLVELSLSHSARNAEKTPAGEKKDDFLRVIRQLQRAKPNGRMVIDLTQARRCDPNADVVLEHNDKLTVPLRPNHVTVAGQVYVPTSHMFRDDRRARDYVKLSGGATVLGRLSHTFVVQANGEVRGIKKRRFSKRMLRRKVQPGARIIVPLNVDRMNLTERIQSWTRSLFETAVLAGIVL